MRETAHLVAHVARRCGVRECDLPDVSQRAYMTFVQRAAQVRAGAERAFLLAIAAREAGHQCRSYRRRREQLGDEPAPPSTARERPDTLTRRKEALARIDAILESLEPALREVLVWFELEQRSLSEIAARLDVPLGTVKSRLCRARLAFAEAALQRFSRSSVLGEEEG